MQTLSQIKAILAERGLRPKHRLGQNFLHDKNQLSRLLEAARVRPGDVVLEVGSGTGTLTEALVEIGAEVIACELDRDLADIVEERLGARITLVRGDCLAKGRTLNPLVVDAIAGRSFKLVANLPYQAASPLMATLVLEHHRRCEGQFVTIQKEVAERLLAPPGGKVYGPLGIIIQTFAAVKRLATVPAGCFWPQPKVTSAMVSIIPDPGAEPVEIEARRAFARFITGLFSKRRKQLGSIFGRDRAWPEGVTPDLRPEALTTVQLVALWRQAGSVGP